MIYLYFPDTPLEDGVPDLNSRDFLLEFVLPCFVPWFSTIVVFRPSLRSRSRRSLPPSANQYVTFHQRMNSQSEFHEIRCRSSLINSCRSSMIFVKFDTLKPCSVKKCDGISLISIFFYVLVLISIHHIWPVLLSTLYLWKAAQEGHNFGTVVYEITLVSIQRNRVIFALQRESW